MGVLCLQRAGATMGLCGRGIDVAQVGLVASIRVLVSVSMIGMRVQDVGVSV